MSLDDTFDMFKEEYPDVSEERIDGLKRSFEELEIIFIRIGIAKPHSFMVWGYAIPPF